MAAKNYPRAGYVYTYAQVCELDLQDSPFLRINHKGDLHPIQDSHIGLVNGKCGLLSIPGFADTNWMYTRTTEEGIPLFNYVGLELFIKEMLTIEVDVGDSGSFWIVPKMFQREQYNPIY